MKLTAVSAVLMTSLLAVGCAGDPPPVPSAADTTGPVPAEATADGALDLGGVVLDAPEGWAFGPPSSSMRVAEAEVPGPGGPALLTVFFFGEGSGGGVDANLDRWASQIEADPGAETERDRFAFGEYAVTTLAVPGTLLPSRMGTGPTEPVPGSMLVGAVLEGPGGPWFFKLTGPAETVAGARGDLVMMLGTARAG